jgi:hypothetical protein
MMLTTEKLAELEYEACQQEKRDRMNARLQEWSLLIGLVGAFGLASFQSGLVGYVVVLYPLLAACLARYTGHSEAVLSQIKAYLLLVEVQSKHDGYESFNQASKRQGVGNHMRAYRDAIVLTDLLAVVVVVARLAADGWLQLAPMVVGLVLIVMVVTCRWLRRSHRGEEKRR